MKETADRPFSIAFPTVVFFRNRRHRKETGNRKAMVIMLSSKCHSVMNSK